ncbi:MAG TPA: HD domain-containing phosphohydrolase [Planctomycetota bacterium]|nr:HD domain-containing phosphohydrolase [Planctomycetota bacterium]
MSQERILIVDDEAIHRRFMRKALVSQGYWVQEAADGQEALDTVAAAPPDLILLDLQMPRLDGFEVCARLKADPLTRLLPIVIVTSLDQLPDRIRALDLGVDDFLNKPVNVTELRTRVRALLRLKEYTAELEHASIVLAGIARVVEQRDAYTGCHGSRVAEAAVRLGGAMGLSGEDLKTLRLGALFHDLGKIAVPDAILRKPGPLTTEEYAVMKSHATVGADLCKPLRTMSKVIPIIRHHHERLDGSGYPAGLRGDEIPPSVRIVTVVDVYDALTTCRPYRAALSREKAFALLRREAAKGWWDADVVEGFSRLEGLCEHRELIGAAEGGSP